MAPIGEVDGFDWAEEERENPKEVPGPEAKYPNIEKEGGGRIQWRQATPIRVSYFPVQTIRRRQTMFTYSPLSREKRETRFFRFSPACQPGSDRISLQLRHASLGDDALQYRALSYVWGDAKDKVDIEVNGEQFSVGQNLHALLQMLQHHGVESWLWADAICIQQSDDDEKSWHVQSMCDIFKNAELVYSWLGSGSEATDVAMNFFSDWGPRALEVGVMEKLWPTDIHTNYSNLTRLSATVHLFILEAKYFFRGKTVFGKEGTMKDALTLHSEEYDMARFFYDLLNVEGLHGTHEKSTLSDLETGITQLLANEYWHRIWIFQEVALAREVLLICGGKLTPISCFEAVLEALWKFCAEPLRGLGRPFLADYPLRRGFCARFPSHLYPNKAIHIRQLLCRGMKVTLGTILVAFSNHTERPWYRATDPRDIVYGILGILANDDRCSFGDVDYTNTTWVDLFTQATRSLIKTSLASMVLPWTTHDPSYGIGHCLPRPRDQPSELPSWVPDWRDVGVNGLPQSLVHLKLTHFDANKLMDNYYSKFSGFSGPVDPMVLRLPGYRVDIVTDVMAYDYQAKNVLEKDRPSNWLARIRDFTGLRENSDVWSLEGEDYVWRLVMQYHNESFLSRLLHHRKYNTEAACFIRRLMRQDYPDPQTLSNGLVESIHESGLREAISNIKNSKRMNDSPITESSNPDDDPSRGATRIVDEKEQTNSEPVDSESPPDSISESDLRSFMDAKIRALFCHWRSRNITLFKTAKGMLGSGIGDVRPGDIVVILCNTHTPFILRPRQQDEDELAANRGGSGSTFTFGGEAWVDGIMYGEFVATEPKEEVFDIY